MAAYNKGLEIDPSNAGLKAGLEEVQSAIRAPPDMGNAMAAAFGPDMWGKIAANPKLSPYLADQSFVNTLKTIQANPNSLSEHLKDPRGEFHLSAQCALHDLSPTQCSRFSVH